MTTTLSENLQRSLALVSACGHSVRSWARRHGVDGEEAYQWSLQNEFRTRVELTRLRVADRMVGRLIRGARLAIKQLVHLCTRGKSEAIRLSASRALLTHWVPISNHFFVKGELRFIKQGLDDMENKQATGLWQPHAPHTSQAAKLP
jgi:hypothetical protein